MNSSPKALAIFVLILFNYWVFSIVVFPPLELLFGPWSQLIPIVVFLGFALAAQFHPSLLAVRRFTKTALCLVCIAAVVLFVNSLGPIAPVTVVGTIFLAMGIFWIELKSTLAFLHLERVSCSFVFAFAYAISHLFIVLSPFIGYIVGLLFIVATSIMLDALTPSASRVLERYAEVESPYDLSITNPFSFVPLNSVFFGLLLAVAMTFGYFSESGVAVGLGGGDAFFILLPIVVLAACFVYNRELSSDLLFKIAMCFIAAALILELAIPGDTHEIVRGISFAGSELIDIVFYWYILILIGSRNELAVLPMLSWGRFVLLVGNFTGIMAHEVSLHFDSYANIPAVMPLCAITFAFFTYIVFAQSAPLFDGIAERIHGIDALPMREAILVENVASRDNVNAYLRGEYHLTARELEVYELLRQGRDSGYIQKELQISRNTVRSHIRNIYSKLDVHAQQDLISLDQELMASSD